jgi:Xaa-Pro aminopeptidase
MFAADLYQQRRQRLMQAVGSGLVLLLGHQASPINFAENLYPFHQDGSFLYFCGLNQPARVLLLDVDSGREVLFADETPAEALVWTGPVPTPAEQAARAGMDQTRPLEDLSPAIRSGKAGGRPIHYLPPYRPDQLIRLSQLLEIPLSAVASGASRVLIDAVVAQRSRKSPEEVAQIEAALAVTARMHIIAMQHSRPGVSEQEVVGAMAGVMTSMGARPAFAPIYSVRGEILHNPTHTHRMIRGDLTVNDSGAESCLHYASDITRSLPVGGRFSMRQKELYTLLLQVQQAAIDAVAPGTEYRQVHQLASLRLAEGLRQIGLLKGNPQEAVAAGAHALFFPHGLGHMLGLDVHDMESLGEDRVGYGSQMQRSTQFGLRSLRLARRLEPGFVITVEPGIYFIPALMDQWRTQGLHTHFVDYQRLEPYRGFGGMRLEDDLLVTESGRRILGPPIPKTVAEVEALCSA